MAGPRLPGPPGIASGGFQGGVPVRPAAPQNGNEFTELSDALGSLSGSVSRAGTQYLQQQNQAKIATSEQLREAADKEAEVIKAQLQGYTAAQIGESLNSEPMAAKFRENPYILPAVNIHRGRVAAGETFQSMIEEGVNVKDPKAVQEYLKGATGELKDPFLAAGFNEEWARRDAQLRSLQSQEALERAEADRSAMGATEFDAVWTDTLKATGSATEAAAATISALYNGEGVNGWEATDIVISKMRAAAVEGNIEMVEALANAPRGRAPSLAADAKVGDEVATHIRNARTTWKEQRELIHVETRTSLNDMIDAGATRAKLENSPEGKLLQAEDPEKWGQVVERHRSKVEQAREESKRRAIASARVSAERNLVGQAASMIADGRGEFIQNFVTDLGDGNVLSVTAASLKQDGMAALRSAVFPDGFEDIADEKLPAAKQYTRKLADSGMKDPLIEGHLQGAGAYMNPENIVGNEKYVANALKLYRQLDASVALQYVPDAKTRAVYAAADQMLTANPKLTVEQAMSRAVANATLPKVKDTPKNIRDVAAGIRLQDYANPKQGGLFGIGAGPNMVDVGDSPLYNELIDRTAEFQQYGMDGPAALAAAKKEVEGSYISVHGRPLRLPNDPKYAGQTPEKWSQTVNLALDHAAATSKAGGKASDYIITHANGVVYTVRRPDGDIDFLTAEQIMKMAGARLQTQAKSDQYGRLAAANRAAKYDPDDALDKANKAARNK